jgi:hypothetical protein
VPGGHDPQASAHLRTVLCSRSHGCG